MRQCSPLLVKFELETENQLGYITNESNAQKIDMAILFEREKQLKLQISEKELLFEKAEKREVILQTTLFELSNKRSELEVVFFSKD